MWKPGGGEWNWLLGAGWCAQPALWEGWGVAWFPKEPLCEAELGGASMSVSVCRDLSQCGGLSSGGESRPLPLEVGIPAEGEATVHSHTM